MKEICKNDTAELEHSRENPKFIALVKMFEAAIEEGILQKDPENDNNMLIYRTGIDAEIYGISEGWCSQPILDVASEMKSDLLNNNTESFENLKSALEEVGISPQFTEDGDFEGLKKVGQARIDIER